MLYAIAYTAKLPILKEEEKELLFKRIKEGDMEARETYIKGNLRLVLSVIRRFAGNAENADGYPMSKKVFFNINYIKRMSNK